MHYVEKQGASFTTGSFLSESFFFVAVGIITQLTSSLLRKLMGMLHNGTQWGPAS